MSGIAAALDGATITTEASAAAGTGHGGTDPSTAPKKKRRRRGGRNRGKNVHTDDQGNLVRRSDDGEIDGNVARPDDSDPNGNRLPADSNVDDNIGNR